MTSTSTYQTLINAKNSHKKAIFEAIAIGVNRDNITVWNIIEIVMQKGEGFVVDIATRANDSINKGEKVSLSEKQVWCIVYAFVKLTDEQIAEFCASMEAEAEETAENVEVEESVEESVEETSSEVRVWNYNAERHILNVHYTDGSQIAVIARPSEMRDVYKARRAGDRAEVDRLITQLANTCSRLEAQPITAENENLALLKQQLDLGVLPEESIEEYHNLLESL